MSKASLFSTVVTTFVAQTYQNLQADYAAMSASLLFKLVLVQHAIANASSAATISSSDEPQHRLCSRHHLDHPQRIIFDTSIPGTGTYTFHLTESEPTTLVLTFHPNTPNSLALRTLPPLPHTSPTSMITRPRSYRVTANVLFSRKKDLILIEVPEGQMVDDEHPLQFFVHEGPQITKSVLIVSHAITHTASFFLTVVNSTSSVNHSAHHAAKAKRGEDDEISTFVQDIDARKSLSGRHRLHSQSPRQEFPELPPPQKDEGW
ncbi:uncharacterized protein ARMOST_08177 [Armillaria ostoyae]|uniref:DUF6535 domain-containing protein n=1 Tax=Armillaria ostoyae TaxID=47428 RepID=A0A284R7W0_ARMOS|nr:uncharacterized protein ARMOST_08177 [Armillaria ostoyae]